MPRVERWMSRVNRLLRPVRWLMLALALSLAMPAAAWAQPKKAGQEQAPEKSYVLPYIIVIAMIGLGLMSIGRPSNRKDKPDERRDDDD